MTSSLGKQEIFIFLLNQEYMIIPNSALDNGQGNCYYVESAGFVSIPDKRSTEYSGVVLVSTGVMQLVKLSPCDGLNGKNKYKR